MRFSALRHPHRPLQLLQHLLAVATWVALCCSVPALAAPPAIATGGNAQAVGSRFTTDQVQAELLVYAPDGVQTGKPLWGALQLTHQPQWHTYWKNPGDSGLPTVLQWQLPGGLSAGDIAWPVPRKIPIGTLANYGYEGTVLLPVEFTVGPGFRAPLVGNSVEIALKASWLVCRRECIPQEGEFKLSLPVGGSTALHRAVFDAHAAALPQALAGAAQASVNGATLELSVSGLPAELHGKVLDFFPETGDVIETAAAGIQRWEGGVWRADIVLSPQRGQSPQVMPFVLALANGTAHAVAAVTPAGTPADTRPSFRVEAPVNGTWPAVAGAAQVPPALQTALAANAQNVPAAGPGLGSTAADASLLLALLGAMLGGLILNLMPCVFPVLAIKVMGFAQHADNTRAHRIGGLAYTAGVVLSFMALGGLMLGLRAMGNQLGWGFQLQSPLVVAALAVLFTVLGLNLAGLFEFGQMLPSRVCTAQAKHPAVNAFLSGMLAVAIASPCTAPFMGASLGLAVSLPSMQALLVFAAMGAGMAAPYLMASMVPAVARLLPRPGAWMNTLRQFMAFPMFATVVWLVWVLGQQTGIDGAGALLGLLVLLCMVMWALRISGRARPWVATISIAICLAFIGTAGQNIVKTLPDGDARSAAAPGARWQAWEPGRVEQTLASGKPVFVDFTAAWCVTCQYNKKTTLADHSVLADFDTKQVQTLRADWTRRDPAISAALSQLGRSGVPVYVLYRAGRTPVVLSEVLSVKEVRAALATL